MIFNESELQDKFNQVTDLSKTILTLTKERNELCREIICHNIETTISNIETKYGVKEGDFVFVEKEGWWYDKNKKSEFIEGYIGGAFNVSYDPMSTDITNIRLRIFKAKKDGSKSMRYEDVSPSMIINIQKIDVNERENR